MARSRSTLAQVVAESLQQSLKDGVYHCGERLVEMTLAQEMNVSQNTVRDALSILEEAGWVVKKPRYGVTVRGFTTEEAKELFTLRATLEKIALGWALQRIAIPQKMHLSQLVSDARLHVGTGNRIQFNNVIFGFHGYILQVADKPYSTQLLTRMHNQCHLLEQIRARHDPLTLEKYADLLTDYGELVTAIRYDKYSAAQNLIYDLIMHNGRTLFPVLDLVM